MMKDVPLLLVLVNSKYLKGWPFVITIRNFTNIFFACLLSVSFSAKSDTLRFITLEVAPWAYPSPDGKEVLGIFPQIVHELEKLSGNVIEITLTPYARINRELESGRQDCTILISDQERENIAVRGEWVFDHPMGVVARKGIKIESYEDLYGIRISLLRGSFISPRFDVDKKLQKDFDTDYEISLRKLNFGRLDAIAGAIPTIQYLAKKNGINILSEEFLELRSEPIYLQCSKKSEKLSLMPSLNSAMKKIKNDGILHSILKSYN